MDKRKAIQAMTRAAALYHADLEDQKVIFLYGVPAEVRKQLQAGSGRLLSIKGYEVAFHRYNFLHLTGVRLNMMGLKQNVTMIGDFTDRGPKLFTEKAAGNVCGCIGFVKDRNTRMNVPNTLLKKDIREVTASPVQKVYAVLSKSYTAENILYWKRWIRG
ncbi:MAG: PBECR4 domain-containing protein [Lachnospiraceae bacterium]|nr:PBECR4 domain-containing protein [Lachnospiraceae bacterium]